MFSKEKELNRVMVPPVYLLICIGLEKLSDSYFPVTRIIPENFASFGAVLIFLGVVIDFWSVSLFFREKTTIKPYAKPKKIVKTGMFKISRNPMYLGMVMVLIGGAIYLGSITSFIGPILFVAAMNTLIIPREEYKMERLFGDSYLEYKNSVRRWI